MSRSWDDWTKHHAMLFALLSDAEERMLREWAVLLGLRGWSAEELWEASEWLCRHDPPRYRSAHLKALEDRLPIVRADKARQARPPEDARGVCIDCRGDGLVSVPNPRDDPLGRGLFYTMVVACHCALGRWKQQHSFGQKGILDIAQYEAAYPDWRLRLAQHDQYLRRGGGTMALTRSIDAALGAIQARRQAVSASAPGPEQEQERTPCVSSSAQRSTSATR